MYAACSLLFISDFAFIKYGTIPLPSHSLSVTRVCFYDRFRFRLFIFQTSTSALAQDHGVAMVARWAAVALCRRERHGPAVADEGLPCKPVGMRSA